jgi:hypothetical protein
MALFQSIDPAARTNDCCGMLRNRMGNKKAREFQLQREREESKQAWERAKSEARSADVDIPGQGTRRLQLIVLPSFQKGWAWEIRQQAETWMLYRSEAIQKRLSVTLVGYELVAVEGAALKTLFQRVTTMSLPLKPDLSQHAGADGTLTQLAVFGDLYTEWRVQWWSHSPPQWKPLADLAQEMFTLFSAVK